MRGAIFGVGVGVVVSITGMINLGITRPQGDRVPGRPRMRFNRDNKAGKRNRHRFLQSTDDFKAIAVRPTASSRWTVDGKAVVKVSYNAPRTAVPDFAAAL